MLHPINHTMSLSKQVAAHTQGAPQPSAFNPSAIRSVTGQNGQPALAILEAIALVKPEWSYSQAHAHWHAFCTSRGLAPAAKTSMPKVAKSRNRVAPMLTTDVNTLADDIMSLPGTCPKYVQKCAAAVYRCYHMEPPSAFVHEPIVASRARQTTQKEPHTLAAAAAHIQVSSVPLATPSPEPAPQVSHANSQAARNATVSLASSVPQDAVSQLGRVFQGTMV